MQNLIIVSGIILSYIAAFGCARYLKNASEYRDVAQRKGRFNVLDGLRGYLALGVFIHHGIMYFYFLQTGDYVRPAQDFSENLGKVSVAIFFIITGFLFTTKLLHLGRNVDWYMLFKSRLFRLVPLYAAVVVIISIIVYVETNGTLQVSSQELVKDYIKWALFHGDTINDYQGTGMIISGVDWSLKYEWLFYLCLPLVALLLRANSLILFALVGIIAILGSQTPDYYFTFNSRYFLLFFIGGLIARAQFRHSDSEINKSVLGQVLFVVLLALCLGYQNTLDTMHTMLIGLLFYFLLTGISQFTLLMRKESIILGEISYSIYLIHGIVLLTFSSSQY